MSWDPFGREPVLFYNNILKWPEKLFWFFSSPFQTNLINDNVSILF